MIQVGLLWRKSLSVGLVMNRKCFSKHSEGVILINCG